jgi:hypothetical protein
VSRCDASDRVRGKTQVVHRRAAQVYMCSGEEGDGMKEEGVDERNEGRGGVRETME